MAWGSPAALGSEKGEGILTEEVRSKVKVWLTLVLKEAACGCGGRAPYGD